MHAAVMKQHAQISATITAEEATEIALKKAQAVSFKAAVKEQKLYIKTQLDALTEQITQQVQAERLELKQRGTEMDDQRLTINVQNHDAHTSPQGRSGSEQGGCQRANRGGQRGSLGGTCQTKGDRYRV